MFVDMPARARARERARARALVTSVRSLSVLLCVRWLGSRFLGMVVVGVAVLCSVWARSISVAGSRELAARAAAVAAVL